MHESFERKSQLPGIMIDYRAKSPLKISSERIPFMEQRFVFFLIRTITDALEKKCSLSSISLSGFLYT